MAKAVDKIYLEQGEGEARVFWEITRQNKTTFTIRFGRYLNAGRKRVKTFAKAAESKQAWIDAIAAKRDEGYAEPIPKEERNAVGTSSKAGISVTNPTLEALIEEQPNDSQRYLVYADWLQQQADPRGELIIIQQRLSTAALLSQKELEALDQMEDDLLTRFEEELTGFFGRYALFRNEWGTQRGFAWRCGFIRAAHLTPVRLMGQYDVPDILEMLFGNPSGRFLEHLVLGNCDLAASCDAIRTARAPATLRTLIIGGNILSVRDGSLAPIWSALPQLQRLVLEVSINEVGCSPVNGLAELHLAAAGPTTLAAISKVEWPTLKRLHITIADARPNENAIAAAIHGMPVLEHLTVRRWLVGGRSRVIPQDALALETAEVAATKKLRRLDLEVGVSTNGGNQLHKQLLGGARAAIRQLRIPTKAIADKTVRAALTTDIPNLEWTDAPEEIVLGDIDPFHHAAMDG